MTERTFRYQRDDFSRAPDRGDDFDRGWSPGRDYGPTRDRYSSARDYAAAGEDRDHRSQGRDQDRGSARDRDWGRGSQGREYRGSYWDDGRRTTDVDEGGYRSYGGYAGYGGYERGRGRDDDRNERSYGRGEQRGGRGREDRGFWDRASDEVRSWFGDEDAERRRERDYAEQDDNYRNWRRSRIAELDRDYDEYRRENAQRFESEFSNWRTDRQGQRDSLSRVSEHMEVLGSDGAKLGTVDKVRGDRIVLTKSDPEADGRHHSIPSRWIERVDEHVHIRKTVEEAKSAWRDEERSGALFGDDRNRSNRGGEGGNDWSTDHNLNRSFSGTY